jgi:ribosomal protein S18 acetylase RimI-like enzyme
MNQPLTTRPLHAADLDAVVAIDRERSGRARNEFYARRLKGLAEEPEAGVAVAAERGGKLTGFALARILDGEFGGQAPVGVLDAIAVDVQARGAGVATATLGAVEQALLARGVREVRTQVDWTEQGLTGFFARAGFRLAPRLVLERTLERLPEDESVADELPIRSMTEQDLSAIVRLDRKVTGRDRSAYYRRRTAEALHQSAIRMALVAERDGRLLGFLMARVEFGEFGRTEPTAVLDTIAVDPADEGHGLGRAMLQQLLLNLEGLRAEQVVTEADWRERSLLAFLGRTGFTHSQRLALTRSIDA